MVNFSTLWQFVLHLYLLCWTEVWLLGVQYWSIMFLIRFKKNSVVKIISYGWFILSLIIERLHGSPELIHIHFQKLSLNLFTPFQRSSCLLHYNYTRFLKKLKSCKLFHDIWGCLIQCKSIICSKWDTQKNRSFSNANCFKQEYCNINYVHYVC